MKNILVTGANGFVGVHLVKELAENGMNVVGVGGHIGSTSTPPFLSEYFVADLNDADDVKKLNFRDIDAVIHLAGLAALGPSFDDPMRYIDTNIGIQTNIFEVAIKQESRPKFLIVSSGNLYDAKATMPLTEKSSIVPSSPYAVSKIGQEQMAGYYGQRGFLNIIVRPFNHIGPGQNPGFIVPDVAQQIVAVEKGVAETVLVGNLDAQRDYTDVRDIVRAYRLLLEKGVAGETYNICSGKPVNGHDIVQGLLAAADSDAQIVEDPEKLRPSDNPVIYGDNSKIVTATGWQPEFTLDQTLHDVITDWRSRS
jgi:GDP-4-dehydro-6-deoxy-D-mannose reductase